MVALSLPFLADAASAAPIKSASFDFTTAKLGGELDVGNESTQGFLNLPASPTPRTFGWILQAEGLVVNWTNVTWLEVGRPTDPSSTYFYHQPNDPVQGAQRYANATVTSETGKPDANLLIGGTKNSAPVITVKASAVEGPAANLSWYAGPESTPTVSARNGPVLSAAFELPAGMFQISVTDASATITGNITMYVWQAALQVRFGNSSHSFESGTQEQPMASGSPPNPYARERVYRLLRIDAENAQLALQVDAGPLSLASTSFPIVGTGTAGFQGTRGVLSQGAAPYTMSQEPLKARGTFNVELSQSPDAGAHAKLELVEGEFEVARPQELTTAIPAPASPWWRTPLWFLGAGILTLVAVPVVIVRRNALVIDDVEWALLSGKIGKSARWAKILIHRNPRDADVLFLYSTALLRLNDPQRMINKVEDLANKIPREKRTGIAYTLAVAAHAAGDGKRLRRWATEAAREPLLRAHLHKQGVWKEQPRSGSSRFSQTGYA